MQVQGPVRGAVDPQQKAHTLNVRVAAINAVDRYAVEVVQGRSQRHHVVPGAIVGRGPDIPAAMNVGCDPRLALRRPVAGKYPGQGIRVLTAEPACGSLSAWENTARRVFEPC